MGILAHYNQELALDIFEKPNLTSRLVEEKSHKDTSMAKLTDFFNSSSDENEEAKITLAHYQWQK